MYTIIMDKYKNLNTTVKTSIFQQESMVDKIQFLIPPYYDGNDLSEYTVTLKYVDSNGNFHAEILTKDAEMYKDYLRYELPVTTNLTKVAGVITLRLTLIKFEGGHSGGEVESEHTVVDTTMVINEEGGDTPVVDDPTTLIIDKLESNSTTFIVQKPEGFNDYVNFEDIEAFKAQIAQLNRDVSKIPNDLAIGDEQNLHLVRDGEQIGEGVEILLPSQFDELDDSNDGIVDVDNLKSTPEPELEPESNQIPYSQFIEL